MKKAFINPEQFERLLIAAKKGCNKSRDEIYLKHEYTELTGEVFICFADALEKYEPSMMPDGKQSIFWFSRYFKHRLRFCMQTYRRHTQHPVTLSAHAVRTKVDIIVQDVDDTELSTYDERITNLIEYY
jgi:hypothetical protein